MSISMVCRLVAIGLATVVLARPAAAQDERRLKQVFEGKRVTALLDLQIGRAHV